MAIAIAIAQKTLWIIFKRGRCSNQYLAKLE